MLKILGKIPKEKFYVACSGGSDSMILVDFLRRFPKNDFEILHFNHGTEYCQEAEDFIVDYCRANNIKLHLGKCLEMRDMKLSQEEFWRNQRYSFLSKFADKPILMAHHLNDCIETWVMTSLSGKPRLIPYKNAKYNIIRPMLAVSKAEINNWAKTHDVKYVYDKSNSDTTIKRNFVRHVMMKDILTLNPGIEKTIRNMVIEDYKMKFAA